MPFIPAAEVWRVSLEFISTNGETAANVIHIKDDDGDMTGVRALQVAQSVRNWVETKWANLASLEWTCNLITVVDAGTQTGASAEDANPTIGLDPTNMLPAQDTVAVKLSTGAMGRSNRGRLYHVGLGEGMIVNGRIAPSFVVELQDDYFDLQAQLNPDQLYWVVTSFQTNGAPRVAAVSRQITACVLVDNKVDRQIRRKG